MTDPNHAQNELFRSIKEKIAPHLSMTDEVSNALSLSADSVYRRIRGEKDLSYKEVQKLASYFKLSPQQVISGDEPDEVVFKYRTINHKKFTLLDYLHSLQETMQSLVRAEGAEIVQMAKDIPVFHNFLLGDLCAFRMFSWQKTILAFPEFENQKFSLKRQDKQILELGTKVIDKYNQIGTTEVWNEATILGLLRQIEFYIEADLFEDSGDAFTILDSASEYLEHIKRQASYGKKFKYGEEPDERSGDFHLYVNELVRADNTMLAKVGDRTITYMTHCTMNFLSTANDNFSVMTHDWILNILKKSDLISTVSEKRRNQFFSAQQAQVKKARERVSYLIDQAR